MKKCNHHYRSLSFMLPEHLTPEKICTFYQFLQSLNESLFNLCQEMLNCENESANNSNQNFDEEDDIPF